MTFVQSIETARAERIGGEGVAASAFEDALLRAGEALDWLRARHADGGLPLLRLPAARDDLGSIRDAARRLSAGASDIVLLGTGGSSLGGQTLAQLAGHGAPGLGVLRAGPRLHFMDNLDPDTYDALLAKLPLATTRFVAISKSGGTIHLEKLDEASLGELLMYFMLETIIAARLLGVDPFDQPAVEEGKVLAKRYLAGQP
jgi:glucose-6-phosphate isomerase